MSAGTLTAQTYPSGGPEDLFDPDGSGWVNLDDYLELAPCITSGGPGIDAGPGACQTHFDADRDSDIDLQDVAGFLGALGHRPILLKDRQGLVLTANSTEPYSGRSTCGGCHDLDTITNGFLFQQGRTDSDGNLDMADNYNGDGRTWIKSAARYGKWGQSFQKMLAAKNNTHPSDMDQTTFAWIRDCGGCHAGGGPGEFDRDDVPLYDFETGQFGYQVTGRSPEEVELDGDYSVLDYGTGAVSPARWDITGLNGPECMHCHRVNRVVNDGLDMHYSWRAQVLRTGTALVDDAGMSVPAFAAAGTAGQGWFSTMATGEQPPRLQINYDAGLSDGSLVDGGSGELAINPDFIDRPTDQACLSCHPIKTITGSLWYDERDIHYRKFANLHDESTGNDLPPEKSIACRTCHPGDLHHDFAKGNSLQVQYRNDLDYVGFRTCRDCHLDTSPVRHPDAPIVPGDLPIHLAPPYFIFSCQACHIPYALAPAVYFRDITVPGSVGTTSQYLSADPLNPADPDKSRWYPSFVPKEDVDGVVRYFPVHLWINIYFANWRQNFTPGDLSDDIIEPIYTWRVANIIGDSPLPGTTDDNGDGQVEINRPAEILAYLQKLQEADTHGRAGAVRPVLVRGKRVWYADPEAPDGISSFSHVDKGIPMTWYPYVWELDHNVLAKEDALGYGAESEGCFVCHIDNSPVLDRLVLVDPFGPDGQPVYETVREQTGLDPFQPDLLAGEAILEVMGPGVDR
jgi:hypothetical protein